MHDIEHRLARLERQNRNLRRWLVALTVVFGFAVFAGAAAQRNPIFNSVTVDTLFAKTVTVAERDGADAPSASLYMEDGSPRMYFSDGQHGRLTLGVYRDSTRVILFDKAGKVSVTLSEVGGTAILRFAGLTKQNGSAMLIYDKEQQIGGLKFQDTRGATRIQIGISKDRVVHDVK